MNERSPFGERLSSIMSGRHLTDSQLAEKSGLCAKAIKKLRNGCKPRTSTIMALAEALDMDYDDLYALSEKGNIKA
jgi:transcriptional regulator with XRE-family HTH domain